MFRFNDRRMIQRIIIFGWIIAIIALYGPTPAARGEACLRPLLEPRFRFVGLEERDIERYATKSVQPSYPVMAQKYKIEGVVTVQVAVTADGRVTEAEFVRGHTVFRAASLDAAKLWQFKPPDERQLVGYIHFTFKLKNG